MIVCLLLVRTVLYLVAEIGNRSGGLGPEEIDRRERAPGAAAGMERMPSPSRARYSYCQPLCRPGPTPPRGPGSRLAPCCSDLGSSCCVATGASGAADAENALARWKLCLDAQSQRWTTRMLRGDDGFCRHQGHVASLSSRFPIFFCSQFDSFRSGCRGVTTEEEDEAARP